MIALLDGDLFCFRAAASCESKRVDEHGEPCVAALPVQIAYARLNEMIEKALRELDTNEYKLFLTDSDGNFRKIVCPDYKANRKDIPRPIHLKAMEEFVIKNYEAERAVGEEADDMLGIAQTECNELEIPSVIVTIDKDLNQVPGRHYNFVKEELFNIDFDESQYNFYKQLMMGDSTDNIKGIPGIGPKKAEKFLMPYYGNEFLMMREVWEQYGLAFPDLDSDEREELITTVGRLVYIRRKPDEMWCMPSFIREEE